MTNPAWTKKGATLSDKFVRNEFGLKQDEIIEAIRTGKLESVNYMHGNPYYKLIRNEVEAFVNNKYGEDHLKQKSLKYELAQIDKEIRKLTQKPFVFYEEWLYSLQYTLH